MKPDVSAVMEAVTLHEANHRSLDYHTEGDELHAAAECPDILAAITADRIAYAIQVVEGIGCRQSKDRECAKWSAGANVTFCDRCTTLAKLREEPSDGDD